MIREAVREAVCKTAIGYEYPPDGGQLPVVDAYDGCQFRCPYCFQWEDRGWNREIVVKTNLPERLAEELPGLDAAQTLFVGSRSDPYMPLEERWGLTRKTLQVLLDSPMPCVLSTKSSSPAFARDIDLFQAFEDRLTVCIGQANLPHLQAAQDQRELPNIRMANRLARLGIKTWVFITPILPGITDVDAMIRGLDDSIPVFLDKVRLNPGSPNRQRFFRFLKRSYPQLEPRYNALVKTGSDPYYEELRSRYLNDSRVKFVFGEN